jgi:hypothetical protein
MEDMERSLIRILVLGQTMGRVLLPVMTAVLVPASLICLFLGS